MDSYFIERTDKRNCCTFRHTRAAISSTETFHILPHDSFYIPFHRQSIYVTMLVLQKNFFVYFLLRMQFYLDRVKRADARSISQTAEYAILFLATRCIIWSSCIMHSAIRSKICKYYNTFRSANIILFYLHTFFIYIHFL